MSSAMRSCKVVKFARVELRNPIFGKVGKRILNPQSDCRKHPLRPHDCESLFWNSETSAIYNMQLQKESSGKNLAEPELRKQICGNVDAETQNCGKTEVVKASKPSCCFFMNSWNAKENQFE